MSRVRQTEQQKSGKQLPKDYVAKSAGDSRNKKAAPKMK